jgi:hypothetical protein
LVDKVEDGGCSVLWPFSIGREARLHLFPQLSNQFSKKIIYNFE